MLVFQVRNFKFLLLFYLILFKTVSVLYLTRDQENVNNYTFEEYVAVITDVDEYGNSSLEGNSNSTIGYDTVVVRVASPIDVYFTPCLITLGVGGNMLALYVFFSSKLRHQSTSQYLSALAISDSLFLGELFPPWLSTIDINGVFHRDAYCKGFVYISYVACCLSAWLVIAFTVERFVAVQFPLQRPSVCTVRRARYVIVALTVASMLVNLPVIHFAGTENQQCNIDREKLEQAAKFNWVDTTVTFTIPLILIIFFNTWIAAVVYKLERNRIKLTQEELRASVPGTHGSRDSDFVYLRSQRRITNMLLIVSTIFVLFNCPAYTLRICGYAYDMHHNVYRTLPMRLPHKMRKDMDSGELDDKWLTAQKVATMMFNANFGINFFLYCLTGQNFRRALVQTVPCFGWLGRKINGLFNRSTVNHARTCSVTTSAASVGTDATLAESSFVRAPRRAHRAQRPPGRYIMRWTFDNSKQRRGTAVSAASESIHMQDLFPQSGPSRAVPDSRPEPGTSRSFTTVRTQAIIETRNPNETKRTALVPRRLAVEPRRAAVDTGAAIRPWRPSDDVGVSTIRPCQPRVASEPSTPSIGCRGSVSDRRYVNAFRRPLVVTRRQNVNLRRTAIESSNSTLELMRPTEEPTRAVLKHGKPVRPKRKSCCF